MQGIYLGAKKVIAYLGEEADGSEQLPALLNQIAKAHIDDIDKKHLTSSGQLGVWSMNEYLEVGLPPYDDPAWHAFRLFLSRPWFVTVWIMQEGLANADLEVAYGWWTMRGAAFFSMIHVAMDSSLLNSRSQYHLTTSQTVVVEAPEAQ
jgi:hypothetical protein